MKHYRALSALLLYPEQELIDSLAEIEEVFSGLPFVATVQPLFGYLRSEPLIVLQERYVTTFDRNPSHSLHLFEHIHGESRDRGQAMVDLMEEYKKHGLHMTGDDLPDYVPLFLEFLSTLEQAEAERLLSDAVHVLAHVGRKLAANGSPYAVIFDVLQALSPVVAEELSEPPVRDMDEALETFGPGVDGVEPLLKNAAAGGVQPINFYPKGTPARANVPASAAA
ncbi:MAG TPA: nitrate reductase molybdenum cofactor assembly chaperone [Noviherbaspirillum sp.]